MRNLPVPNIDSKAKLTDIINSKNKNHKEQLLLLSSGVKNRYDTYELHSNRLENIPSSNITPLQSSSLISCYTSRTDVINTLRSEITNPDLDDFDKCPYCGINSPKSIDHYLPKDDFPEFSVLPINLIPVCGECNSSYKGTNWVDNGQRLFLHSYYDIFPNEIFFVADVVVGNNIQIDFKPIVITGEQYFSDLFGKHFEKLHLNDRYKIMASSQISRKKRRLEIIYRRNNSADDVSRFLRDEAENLELDYSKNHWKAVLYHGLANSADFCNAGFRKQILR